jgi:hypothetical protein
MNPGTLLGGPDYVAAWIRVDRLIHRVVVQRLVRARHRRLTRNSTDPSSCTDGWRSG